ncbi:MAG TPA: hypothetical protein VF479_06560 [Pseudolysinimonas sp.]
MSDTSAEDPTAPPKPPPNALPAAPPAKTRPRWILPVAISGGAVLLIVGGLVAAVAVLTASHAPERPVAAYLDAIVAGHVEDAMAGIENAPRSPLLDDDVYAATDDRITGYTITSVSVTGATAVATVELTTASGSTTSTVDLVSTGIDLLWQKWAVDGEKLPVVDIGWFAPDDFEVSANGVALSGVSGRQHYAALPGSYEFAPAVPSDLITAEQVTATIRGLTGAGDSVDTAVVLTEEAEKEAGAALKRFIDGCIKQHKFAPKGGCGFAISSDGGSYPTLNWSILARPHASFEKFDGVGFPVTTTKTGSFKLDGRNSQYIVTGTVKRYEYWGYISVDAGGKVTFTSLYED